MEKILLGIIIFTGIFSASAHCDTKNGPVISAATQALESNNVNLVLYWVPQKDEKLIREAFDRTVSLRKINPEVRQSVDNYFFETLVRIHRAGEGFSFTGISDSVKLDPIMVAADNAIKNGNASDLLQHLTHSVEEVLLDKFAVVQANKNYNINDVEAGRQYVKNYVEFIHYVEAIYSSAHNKNHNVLQAEVAPVEHRKENNGPVKTSLFQKDYLLYVLVIICTLCIVTLQLIIGAKILNRAQ